MADDGESRDGLGSLPEPGSVGADAPGDGEGGVAAAAGLELEGEGVDAPALPVFNGGGKRTLFITEEEVRASEGEANMTSAQDRKGRDGVVITVGHGTAAGWLFLKMQNTEMSNQSLQGQLFAAGLTVQSLRSKIAQLTGEQKHSGLLVPADAQPSGLVVPG